MAALPWIGFYSTKGDYYGLESTRKAYPFTLLNGHNKLVSLKQLTHKITYFTFGYRHCSHSCPVQLATLKRLQRLLGDKANYAWVSLDPLNDRKASTSDNETITYLYPSSVDEAFRLAKKYRVTAYLNGEDNPFNYINHQDYIYLIDEKKNIRLIYQGASALPEKIEQDFYQLTGI